VTRLAVVPVGPGDEPKLRRDEKRLKRRRLAMVRNRALASTPQELLAVAFDFFRAMAVDPSIEQRERDAQSALMAQMLEDRGNQLAKPRRRNR
jgi:hypothetical protein